MLLPIILAAACAGAYLKLGGRQRAPRVAAAQYILPHTTLHDCYEGIFISGSVGAGKTSGPGQMAARRLLAVRKPHKIGFLVLCGKPGEAKRWKRYCELEGRADDYVRVAPDTHSLDALTYCLTRPHGSVEDAAGLLDVLLEVAMRAAPGGGGEEIFWKLYGQQILRNAITLPLMAFGKCSLVDVYNVIVGAPNLPGDLDNPQWRAKSFVARCIAAGKERHKDNPDWTACRDFWAVSWPMTSDRQKATGATICTNLLSKFVNDSRVRKMVSSGVTTFSPDDIIKDGKVGVIDCPVLTFGIVGRFLNVTYKTILHRAATARDIDASSRSVCVWMDEGQLFCVPDLDASVQAIARESLCINCVLTQTLPGVQVALGANAGSSMQAHAWLSNFNTKVMCANGCMITNQYCSSLLGSSWQDVESGDMPGPPEYDPVADVLGMPIQGGGRVSWRADYRPDVPPECFSRLLRGGGGLVEAYVFRNGATLPNGKTWSKELFTQG